VKFTLGKFARSGIEAQVGADPAEGVRAALALYAHRVKSGWKPLGPPKFGRPEVSADPADAFEVSLEAETLATMEGEALKHQVSMDRILSHAVLTYLADLDAARTGEVLLEGGSSMTGSSPESSVP
jgi:hypothetical protein